MNIVAFGASNSKNSINQQLAVYAASLVSNATIDIVDLNDYELPIFSMEREAALGKPELALALFDKLGQADAIVISFAEHNGSYTAAYKNIFDWMSRIDQKVFQQKPMVLLATSPGPGGAKNVLQAAVTSAPHFAGNVKGSFSLPKFYEHFDSERQAISDETLKANLQQQMASL